MRRLAPARPCSPPPLLAGCGGDDERARGARLGRRTTQLDVEVTRRRRPSRSARAALRRASRATRRRLDALARSREPRRPGARLHAACTAARRRPTSPARSRAEPVDVTLDRTDGCGIADYEALFAALGRSSRPSAEPNALPCRPLDSWEGSTDMTYRFGRRVPAVLTTLALAAVVGATPAPAAATGHNHSELADCNALLPRLRRCRSAGFDARAARCVRPAAAAINRASRR